MIKKNILAYFFIVISMNLFSQVQSTDIYNAINQLIEINNVTTISKGAKPLIINESSMEKYFYWCLNFEEKISISQIDSVFINQQIRNTKDLIWDRKKLKNNVRIKRKSVDYFTIPLFLNKNMDLLVVYHRSYVGPTDGQGKLELYKKVNGVWKLINFNLEWVS